jgi:hypothetical protein
MEAMACIINLKSYGVHLEGSVYQTFNGSAGYGIRNILMDQYPELPITWDLC